MCSPLGHHEAQIELVSLGMDIWDRLLRILNQNHHPYKELSIRYYAR
jgi:hypothetical protein